MNADDPLNLLQNAKMFNGSNLYVYCANDPVGNFDPTGAKFNWHKFWGIIGTVSLVFLAVALSFTVVGAIAAGTIAATIGTETVLYALAYSTAVAGSIVFVPSAIAYGISLAAYNGTIVHYDGVSPGDGASPTHFKQGANNHFQYNNLLNQLRNSPFNMLY